MKRGMLKAVLTAVLGAAFAVAAVAAPPTVNGLFYGDGDNAKYSLVGSDPGRGDMYMYLDGTILHVAVVVSTNVNDNVFSSNKTYTQSAGWPQGNARNVGKLIGSDNMEFKLTVGGTSWQWKQDYVYASGVTWLSDNLGPDAGGTPPPGYVAASSLQWNFLNSAWDYTMTNAVQDDWKSPDADADNDATDEDGFSTWSALHQWEWTMVYEFSVDLSAYPGQIIRMETISAHNSPSKDDDEDVPIDEGDLLDFGDAPNTYGTLLASDGARHLLVVGGPRLGALVDAESNGQPTVGANGDDLAGSDDEDGVVFLTPVTPSTTGLVQVTGTAGAKLNAWIDFNDDGVFAVGEQIAADYVLSGGADVIDYVVPANAATEAPIYARFRVNNAGGLGPTGPATDGEVEDYLVASEAGDYVWLDANRNGIQDPTESGLANVGIDLFKMVEMAVPTMNADDVKISASTPKTSSLVPVYVKSTITDENGFYSFGGLAPGSYKLLFHPPTPQYVFTTPNVGTDDTVDSDADLLTGESHVVTLSAGQVDLTVDAGMYIKPTRVVLTDFAVEAADTGLTVHWATAEEQGAIGFFLERWDAAADAFVRVNQTLLPASFDSYDEVAYSLTDAGAPTSGTVVYRLLELENTGAINTYGPFSFELGVSAAGRTGEELADGGEAAGKPADGQTVVTAQEQAAVEAPRVTSVAGANGSLVLRWASVEGAVYGIERAASLTGEFLPLVHGLPATAPENVVILVDGAEAGFFRIVRQN